MNHMYAARPQLLVTIDVTNWREGQRNQLMAAIDEVREQVASAPIVEETGHGWTKKALDTLLSRLAVGNGAVQAKAIAIAIANGGEVTREQIFELGEYSPGRKLKGFTRPVNRIARQMRNAGEVSAEAINPFLPVYDPTIKGYQQAKRFRVPHAIVKLWNESVDEHDGA
jgi:hypothetical protein